MAIERLALVIGDSPIFQAAKDELLSSSMKPAAIARQVNRG